VKGNPTCLAQAKEREHRQCFAQPIRAQTESQNQSKGGEGERFLLIGGGRSLSKERDATPQRKRKRRERKKGNSNQGRGERELDPREGGNCRACPQKDLSPAGKGKVRDETCEEGEARSKKRASSLPPSKLRLGEAAAQKTAWKRKRGNERLQGGGPNVGEKKPAAAEGTGFRSRKGGIRGKRGGKTAIFKWGGTGPD